MVSMIIHIISKYARNSLLYLIVIFDNPIVPPKRAILKCNIAPTSDSVKNVGQASVNQ